MQLIQTENGPRLARNKNEPTSIEGRTSEAAVSKMDCGRYDLILIACARVRELHSGHAKKISSTFGDMVTVIKEIEGGHIDAVEYFTKATAPQKHR
jgi:hypothetical protein